jgi:hypothetical protein
VQIEKHKFTQGMKLEAVNPNSSSQIGPATIAEVIDDHYFVVEMDEVSKAEGEKKTRFACHSKSPYIFPTQWTVYKGIKLTAPQGWSIFEEFCKFTKFT